ncbi:hypothetical protein BH23BAC3_BH23BAC3_31410 [soil metagenome]
MRASKGINVQFLESMRVAYLYKANTLNITIKLQIV